MPSKKRVILDCCSVCGGSNFFVNGNCRLCAMRVYREAAKGREEFGDFFSGGKEDSSYVRSDKFKERFAKAMEGVWYG